MFEQLQEPLSALTDPLLEPLFHRPRRLGVDSAWYGHLPFARWIVRATRPLLFVELGTHAGVSYSGFCDAVQSYHLPTNCLAIDTWKGDDQAGFYGEEIYEDFVRFHDQHYGGFSRLLRCRFDEALDMLPDGEGEGGIDLLHVDGHHLFTDITHNFETWLPKLSRRGVILFHDTNERERDFGVWRFWETQRQRYPSFEFLHGHGLGILAVGENAPDTILELCRLSGTEMAGALRERFSLVGERWIKEHELLLRDKHIMDLTAKYGDPSALLANTATLEQELANAQHRLVQADEFLRNQSQELDLARAALSEANAARQNAEQQAKTLAGVGRRLVHADQLLRDKSLELGLARSALAEANASRHNAEQQAETFWNLAQKEAESARTLLRERDEIVAALTLRTHELDLLRNAFFWRMTAPLRAFADKLRPKRRLRGTALDGQSEPNTPLAMILASTGMPSQQAMLNHVRETPPPASLRPIHHVLFVIGEPRTPGATYRCERNASACRAAGYTAEVVELYDVNPENLARADLLVLWRAAMCQHVEIMIGLAKEAGTRVAFDIDDLMIMPELAVIDIIDGIRTIGANEADTGKLFATMQQTMLAADVCIATTEELATQMRQQRDAVYVLPNTFDEATLRRARFERRKRSASGDDGYVRLGYAGGTRTHQKDFAQVASALASVLAARTQALLVLFRDKDSQQSLLHLEEFPELKEFVGQIEWRDTVPLADLPGEMARFDISLCPLETGNPFCEAKSELKYFESALAGVCTVASPTGPYLRTIRDDVTGFLAGDAEKWERCLLHLIDSPADQFRVARNAYHDALWRFGPWRQSDLVSRFLGGLDAAQNSDTSSVLAAASNVELGLHRGAYLGHGLPEVPECEVLFQYDRLGEANVTVVVTSYNYETHILEALDSARIQSLDSLDIVIVDDGSTDQSVPLVIEWAKCHHRRFNRVKITRTIENAGLGGARNAGFDAAETPWLMVLDSDNRLLANACEHLLAAVQSVPRAAFAYPRIRQFGGSEFIMGMHGFEAERLRTGNYIDAMALVAKWAWAAAGGYYVRREAMGWEDYDLWLNLIELGQFGIAVPEILAEYRVHENSMVNAITEQSDNKSRMVAFVEQRHPWLCLRPGDRGARPRR